MKLVLHPIVLFFMGSFIGLSPFIFGSSYFELYRTFHANNEILLVYMIGFLSFTMGVTFIRLLFKRKSYEYYYVKKDINIFLLTLISLSMLVFIKIISIYGSLPLLAILSGNETIAFVNQTQKDVGGGIFGVFFLMVVSLIVLFPYSVINKKKSLMHKIIFWVHLLLLIVYTTYSGKRQMLFIFFTYTFSYLILFYQKIEDKKMLSKIKKSGTIFFVLLIGVFLSIGLLRANLTDADVSIFDPIVHYASLPYINLTNIISHQELNENAYTFTSFYETLLNDLPTFIKGVFLDTFTTVKMPLIEPTSPSTIYGEIFWGFGYIGVGIYLLIVGMISGTLYYKALYNKNFIYIVFYSMIVWPLLSIHTYNHFKNFMFLLIPFVLIFITNKIYKKIPKKGRKNVTKY